MQATWYQTQIVCEVYVSMFRMGIRSFPCMLRDFMDFCVHSKTSWNLNVVG